MHAREPGQHEQTTDRRGADSSALLPAPAPGRAPTWTAALGERPPADLFAPAERKIAAPANSGGEQAHLAIASPPARPALATAGLTLQRAAAPAAPVPAPEDQAVAPVAPEPGPTLLLDDDAPGDPAPGQMRRRAFLAALQTQVCQAAEAELAGTEWSARSCPYIAYWFGYYAQRSARQVERALHRYAPETARAATVQDYFPLVVARVRQAVAHWRATGAVSGVPAEVPLQALGAPPMPAPAPADEPVPIARKAVAGGSMQGAPPAIQRQLGAGRPLESGVRRRMEQAFGADFTPVRLHTDRAATRLARDLRARAFTVGEHVAFGAGEYQPGTPGGDALLAHELAHVVQQGGARVAAGVQTKGGGSPGGLEADADRAAVGAVAALWGGVKRLAGTVVPALRSGLQLQRCGGEIPGPSIAEYQERARQSLDVFRDLYERKHAIVEGTEPIENLSDINSELEAVMAELRELGVNLSEYELYERLQRGVNVLQVSRDTARIIRRPDGDLFSNERAGFEVQMDYVPPGRIPEISWGFRVGGFRRSLRGRSSSRTLELDEAFWSRERATIERFGPEIEISAQIYIEDTLQTTLSTGPIAVTEEIPATLTLEPDLERVILGQSVNFRIAEFAPSARVNPLAWYVDGTRVALERPTLHHTFNQLGSHTIRAVIHRRTSRWRFGEPIREATHTLQVIPRREAAEAALNQIAESEPPNLATTETTIRSSISELRSNVQRGGELQSYWESRLEAQEDRLTSFLANVPAQRQNAQPLPDDLSNLSTEVAYSGPIPTVLIIPNVGDVQPVDMQLTLWHAGGRWQATLNDATGRDVYRWDGSGSSAMAAAAAAFRNWIGDNPYPRHGTIFYRFRPDGWPLSDSFSTYSSWKTFMAWVDAALTVGSVIAAGILLLVPEPTGGTKALAYVVLAAGVARSSYAIYENIRRGVPVFDERNVLEAVSIVASFAGLGGGALRQVGLSAVRPVSYRIGNYLVLSSVAADVGTIVYLTNEGINQIQAVRADPTLDESQRSTQIARLTAQMLLQGAMFVVSNRELFQNGLRPSDFIPTDPRATARRAAGQGEVRLDTGERLDIAAELRRAGNPLAELRGPGALSNRQLVDRFQALPWLRGTLNDAGVQDMLLRLDTDALVRLGDIDANRAHAMLNAVNNDAVINRLAPALGGQRLQNLDTQVLHNSRITLAGGGQLDINGQITIHPGRLREISDADINNMLIATRELDQRGGDMAQVSQANRAILEGLTRSTSYRLRFEFTRQRARQFLQTLGVQDHPLFNQVSGPELDRVYDLANRSYPSAAPNLRNQAAHYALGRNPGSVREFVEFYEFYVADFMGRAQTGIARYEAARDARLAEWQTNNPGATPSQRDRQRFADEAKRDVGIPRGMSAENYFYGGLERQMADPAQATRPSATAAQDVTQRYEQMRQQLGGRVGPQQITVGLSPQETVTAIQQLPEVRFGAEPAAVYHARKHVDELPASVRTGAANDVTAYLDAARQTIRNADPAAAAASVRTSQQGQSRTYTFQYQIDGQTTTALVSVDTNGQVILLTFQ